MSSPGVSTRYSIDSITPERTGPCGIVNRPGPMTCRGIECSSGQMAGRRRPGAPGRGRGALLTEQRQDQRLQPGVPVGDDPEQVMDLPLVPERGAQHRGQRRV